MKNTLGLAPVIGIEFQLSKRISLQTEGSFLMNLSRENDKQYNVLLVDNPNFTGNNEYDNKTIEFDTRFAEPFFLVILFSGLTI